MSAPVPLGYAEKGNCTEREKDPAQNKITQDPGDACEEERQAGEQKKVTRFIVHSRPLGRILAHARMGIFIRVDGIPVQRRILRMLAIRITGNQLRAGRALAGLSMEDLADRAKLCRRSISKWEGSSNAVPDASRLNNVPVGRPLSRKL